MQSNNYRFLYFLLGFTFLIFNLYAAPRWRCVIPNMTDAPPYNEWFIYPVYDTIEDHTIVLDLCIPFQDYWYIYCFKDCKWQKIKKSYPSENTRVGHDFGPFFDEEKGAILSGTILYPYKNKMFWLVIRELNPLYEEISIPNLDMTDLELSFFL